MSRDSLPDGRTEDVYESREHELVKCLKGPIGSSPVHSDLLLGLEKPLVELINISRTSEGRAKLAELEIIPSIVVWFGQVHAYIQPIKRYTPEDSAKFIDLLLLLLKLTRNLCAGDATNQDALLEAGGVAILAPTATTLLRLVSRQAHRSGDFAGPSHILPEKDSMLERMAARFSSTAISSEHVHMSVSRPVDCLQMLLQLLGNFARRGEASQASVWEEFFPTLVLDLAVLRINSLCGPLCMVLYTCCQSNAKRCWQLCQGDGAALIAILMVSTVDSDSDIAPGMDASSEEIEWFEVLVQHLCIGKALFPLLFTNLGVPPLSLELDLLKVDTDELLRVCQLCLETSTGTSLQAGLIYILCDCLNQSIHSSNSTDLSTCGDENEQCGVKLPMPLNSLRFMVDILRRAAQSAVKDTELHHVPTLPSSVPVQILEAVLSLLRISCAWDGNHGAHTKVTTLLLSHGLVELLLGLLEALGAPEAPGKGPVAEYKLGQGLELFPQKNLYEGYRRDIVAVIANISYQSFFVQERVRENGSLILVLQQCMVEKENPFLREWGLWAMRNLLEGNRKNQEEIADLEVKESMNLPELSKMGLNVKFDRNTGRPHLVNDNSSSSQP